MNAVCAGCRTIAPQETDEIGYKRMTPTGWLWLTALGGGGQWYFCSLACVADWSARCCDPEYAQLAATRLQQLSLLAEPA